MRSLPPLRVLALAALAVNVAFNALYHQLDALVDTRVLSDRHHSLVTPAPWAFAIWALIYGALAAQCVYALLPSQRSVPFHDVMARLIVVVNVLAMVWVAVFTSDHPVASVPVLFATLAVALRMYVASELPRGDLRTRLLGVPSALLAAWMSVATIVGTTAAFVAGGARPDDVGWAVVALATATALGIVTSIRFRDAVFPAVVAWATHAIAAEVRQTDASFATFAEVCAALSLAVAIGVVLTGIAARVLPALLPDLARRGDAREPSHAAANRPS